VSDKLDPQLLALVEQSEAGQLDSQSVVDVLVGLDAPLDPARSRDLTARGLTIRSEIGTVLTGSIQLQDVARLAASEHVIRVDASTPLYREPHGGGEGPP
jgi:hypothetical protein